MSVSGGGKTETLWHQCVLVGILVVGACARFYSLDQNSLSSDELRNLASCDIKGWLAMASDYQINSGGMPPLYPTLLCLVTNLTSDTEFFVRLLSAVAGLVALYFVYITGRDFISPTVGLLAAALLSTEYRTIFLNRDATLYSLLALCSLIHNYYFCQLFFSADCHNTDAHDANAKGGQPVTLGYRGTHVNFQWSWRPDFPGNAWCLAGFWISGALVFYTSPMSLIQLISELLASAILIKNSGNFANWRGGMSSLWLPLLILMLPWMPIFYGYIRWIIQGHLFAFQTLDVLWQQIKNLVPFDANFRYLLAALLAVFPLFMVALNFSTFKRLKKFPPVTNSFVCFILFQLLIAVLSLWLIMLASQLSYVYFWWSFLLLMLIPASVIIEMIPREPLKTSIVAIVALAIIVPQVNLNGRYYSLYTREVGADFQLAAKIIHDDQHFMNGDKDIIVSSKLFNHYLQVNNAITHNVTVLDEHTPFDGNKFSNNPEFYFLEYLPQDINIENESQTFQSLSSQYKKLCMTKIPRIRVVKFSRDLSTIENATQDCRVYLLGTVSLQ